jgi:2-dehydro-3-deoxyphosphogluconate aldolase/(4S)-4-hydroxy-2-oxoglutarate aldolase
MSGASGKVPAAIHVSPEALPDGPLARVRDGSSAPARSTTPQQAVDAVDAGAAFLVSPGTTPGAAGRDGSTPASPFLPALLDRLRGAGVLREAGLYRAEVLPGRGGGRRAVPLVARRTPPRPAVLPHGRHHRLPRRPRYLALPNVGCVGGSWLTPAAALAAGDWDAVEQLARDAATLAGS